jgi:hypothetical protein
MDTTKQSYKLTRDERAEMVRRFQTGEAKSAIARRFGVRINTVRQAIKSAGIDPTPVSAPPPELWDYYLDILEWAIPPLAVSTLDERVSSVAIATLASWRYLRRTGLKAGRHPLWETSPAGRAALVRHGRSAEF